MARRKIDYTSISQMDSNLESYSVCFKDSELISGTLGKATLGDSKSGLFYCLLKDNSNHVSAVCMLRFAKFSARWLTNWGMTLGIGDVTPEQSLVEFKKKMIQERFDKCTEIIEKYNNKQLRTKPGCTPESTLEDEVSALLNEIRDGKYCFSNLPATNSALKMAICGSKGSNLNLCQMIACVGQQIVSGKRQNGFYSEFQTGLLSEPFPTSKRTLKNRKQEDSFKIRSTTDSLQASSSSIRWQGEKAS